MLAWMLHRCCSCCSVRTAQGAARPSRRCISTDKIRETINTPGQPINARMRAAKNQWKKCTHHQFWLVKRPVAVTSRYGTVRACPAVGAVVVAVLWTRADAAATRHVRCLPPTFPETDHEQPAIVAATQALAIRACSSIPMSPLSAPLSERIMMGLLASVPCVC